MSVSPAPQPPADGATNESGPAEMEPPITPGHEWVNGSLRKIAAAPVSGDGDASLDADVREILARRGLPDSLFPVGLNDRIASAVREGIARGRALGARDERELFVDGLTCDASESKSLGDCCHNLCRDVLAIARRGGRGTL